MDLDEIKKHLEAEYLLLRRRTWWSFIGGMVAFLLAVGVVSYKSALSAAESKAAKDSIQKIEEYKSQAVKDVEEIHQARIDYADTLTALSARLSKVENRLAHSKDEHQIDVSPFGNFPARWFDLKCNPGEFLIGYGFEISPYIIASGPGVDSQHKTRTVRKFRAYCAKR